MIQKNTAPLQGNLADIILQQAEQGYRTGGMDRVDPAIGAALRETADAVGPGLAEAFRYSGLGSLSQDTNRLAVMAKAASEASLAAFVAAPQQPATVKTSLRISGQVEGLPKGKITDEVFATAKPAQRRPRGVAKRARTGLGREAVGKGRFTPVARFERLDQPMPLGTEQKTLSPAEMAEQQREAARLQPSPLPAGRPPRAGPVLMVPPLYG